MCLILSSGMSNSNLGKLCNNGAFIYADINMGMNI